MRTSIQLVDESHEIDAQHIQNEREWNCKNDAVAPKRNCNDDWKYEVAATDEWQLILFSALVRNRFEMTMRNE